MSSHTIQKKVIIFPYYNIDKEDSINFNEILIPFSNFGKSTIPEYIYKGDEIIRFNERHSIYKKLLLDEFIGKN